ncbi:cache domain-containing sensor histidine kinase [Azospirillum sp.]|uniref:sensor histidine kinase n=1 Tax=Azospirillum sp. TaxID=34012 RepID=UPI003D72A248
MEHGGRVLTAAIVAMACLLLGWWAADTVADRQATHDQARMALRTAQALLTEHARGNMEDVRDTLDQIAARVLRDGPPAPGATGDWHPWLAGQLPRLPGVAMLSYIAPDGRMMAASWAPDAGADVSDRDYVRAHRDGARLYVSRPGFGPAGGPPLFRLSLRIEEAGRFAGIAVAAFRTDYFATFYRNAGLPELPLSIAILRENGAPIVQEPRDGAPALPLPFGPDPVEGERTVLLKGKPLLVSIGRVPDMPLLVAASASEAAVLAPWRRRALMSGGLAGVCVVVIILLGRLAGRSLRREQAMLVALQAANAELAAAVRANQEARRQAESANTAKSRLLAAISHDLGQPLRALQFHLEALDHTAAARPEPAQLAKMRAAVEAQQDMLDQLVAASALENGALPLERRRVPLSPLLAEAVDLCRNEAARTGVELRMVGCSLHLHTDPALLRRLLMNLIANAARYTANGRVLVGCRRGDEAFRIEVWDTGPGLADDEMTAVFEAFRRGSAAAGTGGLGLGLGLAIVRRLSETLGMTVRVASVPGRGSCFAVAVPWDQVHESAESNESKFHQEDHKLPDD